LHGTGGPNLEQGRTARYRPQQQQAGRAQERQSARCSGTVFYAALSPPQCVFVTPFPCQACMLLGCKSTILISKRGSSGPGRELPEAFKELGNVPLFCGSCFMCIDMQSPFLLEKKQEVNSASHSMRYSSVTAQADMPRLQQC
jgi:hypothetical protein